MVIEVKIVVPWGGGKLTEKGHRGNFRGDENILYIKSPQPPGHGPIPVRGLLGTGMHSRR